MSVHLDTSASVSQYIHKRKPINMHVALSMQARIRNVCTCSLCVNLKFVLRALANYSEGAVPVPAFGRAGLVDIMQSS
jgi:hypothetical protein